jgi:hypothetical protein
MIGRSSSQMTGAPFFAGASLRLNVFLPEARRQRQTRILQGRISS